MCLTLVYTGARPSEIVALTDRQIDLTNGRIVIESLKKWKTGVFRAVPVPKDLLRTLDLVHELMRRRRTARPLWEVSRTTAWRWVGEVMEAADLSGPAATPKGLRHAFAIAALDKGVPLNMVQKWLGHAQISTTAIYGDAIGAEETALAARLWGSKANVMQKETMNLRHGAKLIIEIADTDDGGQAVRCSVRFSDGSLSQPMRVRLDTQGLPEEWGGRQDEDDQL